MKFQSEVTVVGAKASKGEYEGNAYDSTKVYVLVSMDASKGMAAGMAAAEYTIGTSDLFRAFKERAYPYQAVGDFEIVTNGKTTKQVLHGLVPKVVTK
jgi:arginine/ornithine N-succinyltransferase beta subunit